MLSLVARMRNKLPVAVQKVIARNLGSYAYKERLGVLPQPAYGYGLKTAAYYANLFGYSGFTAIELGVAGGRGLRKLIDLAAILTKSTGLRIDVVGFDAGSGLPPVEDYRDHPEEFSEGDFPMVDFDKLQRDIEGGGNLVIGDVQETIEPYLKDLRKDMPIGFVSIDLDLYSSTRNAMRLFEADSSCYLPLTSLYFDDCGGRTEYNEYCGELLAIEEFNATHELRKVALDRGVRAKHVHIGYKVWFEKMYVLHCFDSELRMRAQSRQKKVL